MYAIQCSFCNRENAPDARYCSECGSPLHLRICPNAHCGKVSAAEAKQCPHCGTYLPPLRTTLASTADAAPLVASASPTDSPPAPGEQPCRPSLVLLMLVAFFCFLLGTSLTLLWCNDMALRASTPSPLPAASAPR